MENFESRFAGHSQEGDIEALVGNELTGKSLERGEKVLALESKFLSDTGELDWEAFLGEAQGLKDSLEFLKHEVEGLDA